MSEGAAMFLTIICSFAVIFLLFVGPQIKRESKWDEEDMICPRKDKKSEDGYDE